MPPCYFRDRLLAPCCVIAICSLPSLQKISLTRTRANGIVASCCWLFTQHSRVYSVSKISLFRCGLVVYLLAMLSACQSPTPLQSPFNSLLGSPLATPVSQLEGPNFEVSPVKAGETILSGHGPYGLPFEIIDVTLSGQPLADGVIDSSGNFKVQLNRPAIAGHILGIQIVNLTGTSFQATDEFVSWLNAKAGPGFKYYPELGAVFASVVVSP